MKKSIMSVKSMIETYVRYGLDHITWSMFYDMACRDLISYDNWMKFANTCKGWKFDDNCHYIIDTYDDCKVIYKMDDNGYWIKVK